MQDFYCLNNSDIRGLLESSFQNFITHLPWQAEVQSEKELSQHLMVGHKYVTSVASMAVNPLEENELQAMFDISIL